MAEKLKHCPFCGGKANIFKVPTGLAAGTNEALGHGNFYVMCNTCYTSGNNYPSEEDARNSWNYRVEERR